MTIEGEITTFSDGKIEDFSTEGILRKNLPGAELIVVDNTDFHEVQLTDRNLDRIKGKVEVETSDSNGPIKTLIAHRGMYVSEQLQKGQAVKVKTEKFEVSARRTN